MTQQILLAAMNLKIVAVLIKTAAIIVIYRKINPVVAEESVVMYVALVLPERR